jgi:hypothetical protein
MVVAENTLPLRQTLLIQRQRAVVFAPILLAELKQRRRLHAALLRVRLALALKDCLRARVNQRFSTIKMSPCIYVPLAVTKRQFIRHVN